MFGEPVSKSQPNSEFGAAAFASRIRRVPAPTSSPSAEIASPAPTTSAAATPTANAPASAHYSGQGAGQAFEFDYPASWSVIGGSHAAYTHGPALMAAVGIGGWDLNCTGSLPGAVDRQDPIWTVPNDGVVLAYHLQDWPQGPIEPYPSPIVEPADRWVQIDGRTALFSQQPDGSMRWSMLGTPEIIEARFGPSAADTAPDQIQAVIGSWHWATPAGTPQPTSIISGSGSATYQWQEVGQTQAGIFPNWAPDSNHVVLDFQAANEYDRFDLLDRTGTAVGNWSALTDMFWLNNDTVEGYEADSLPPWNDQGQYQMVAARSISVSNPTPVPVMIPCCQPVSNGHGAVAITRLLPDKVQDLPRPRFVVWHDGVQSEEREGQPIAWDLAGDRLIVIHPTQPEVHGLPEGWMEVLRWPDLTPVFQDDPSIVIGDAAFDPTGNYATYLDPNGYQPSGPPPDIHIIDLDSGATAKISLAGASYAGALASYVWNDQGQLLVLPGGTRNIATYLPDGTLVSTTPSTATSLQASANGQTIVASTDFVSERTSEYGMIRGGVTQPLTLPVARSYGVGLSPDGTQLFVSGTSPDTQNQVGYFTSLTSPPQ